MKKREIDYIVWKEDNFYVSRCLNVEVSSFGSSKDEAVKNLKEAVELFLEGEEKDYFPITNISLGREIINA
jgi:predicted RNase H-like HicB family nuclease